MVGPLFRLAIGLQTVAQPVQEVGYHLVTDRMLHPHQFRGQLANALTGPPQGGFRITPGRGFQQILQIGLQRRVLINGLLPPTTLAADATGSK